MAATEPIRNKRHVTALADYYLQKGQLRNYTLILMGVHTALRISDLLRIKWDDVYDFDRRKVRSQLKVIEQKTGKTKCIALNKGVIRALQLYRTSPKAERGRYLFESNRKNREAISRIQAYRIVRAAVQAVGVTGTISCHSLRKTFGYHAWKAGVSPVVIMDIYNHTSFAVTRRYLGVSQDDRDKVYRRMSFA